MKNSCFLSLLCMALGVQFAASADLPNQGRKAPNDSKAKVRKPVGPLQPKPAVQTLLKAKATAQAPKTFPGKQPAIKQVKNKPVNKADDRFKHKSSSHSSSFWHKPDCCDETREILEILKTQCIHYIKCVPYEICESGYYRLACDLVFDPAANGVNAITLADGITDVNIDFAGYTLSMSASSTKADNNGILINSGCENIVIHDGSIVGFSASAIRGYEALNTIEACDMILEGIPSGNRMVSETIASGVNLGAIVQSTTSNSPVQTPPSYNINLKNLTIRGFLLNNLSIADQAAWGTSLWYCNDILLDHVDVSQLTMNGLVQNSLTNCQGFAFQFCTNSICRFCSSKDLVSLSPDFNALVVGDAVGSVYLKCARCENYDCSFSNNRGTRRAGGFVWVGTNDFLAERCVADGNRLVSQTAAGIQSHWGFEAIGIVGIGIPRPQRGVVKDCHVLNQPTAFVASACDDVIYENCTATAGDLSGVATVNTVGFQCSGTSNGVTFKNCIATGFNAPNPTTAGGFRVSSGSNINIIDCISTKNAIGIYVQSGVTRLVADSNEVAFNTFIGLQDTTAVQTPNLYTRNVAFANVTNYSVNTTNPNFVVVQTSQAAGYPLYTAANASPLSNFSLQP